MNLTISDDHDLGYSRVARVLSPGEVYNTTYQGPYGSGFASTVGVAINITFNEDGSATIAEGSVLPTNELDDESCTVSQIFTPFTDELIYGVDLNARLVIPSSNLIGYIPNNNNDNTMGGVNLGTDGLPYGYTQPLVHQGKIAGALSLSESNTFDFFPLEPEQPTLCDGDNNCFDVILQSGEVISGGELLPGFTGGYILRDNLETIAPLENDCADLYIEWHAIDGAISGSGLGDIIGNDEDGDGTDFDSVWGMQSLEVTKLKYEGDNAECNYQFPVLGNILNDGENLEISSCIDEDDDAISEGTKFYIMGQEYSNWGNFYTYNAHNGINVDDSGYDYSGDNSQGGRIVWKFDPTCIDDAMVRHFMLEFKEVGTDCGCTAIRSTCGTDQQYCDCDCNVKDQCGICNGDNSSCSDCAGVPNGLSETDNCGNCIESTLINTDGGSEDCVQDCNNVWGGNTILDECGVCGGSGSGECGCDGIPEGACDCEGNVLDCAGECGGDAVVDECGVCGGNGPQSGYDCEGNLLSIIESNVPQVFSVNKIYPNPFNPITSISYDVASNMNLKIVVIDLNGRELEELTNKFHVNGNYVASWDASSYPSGLYFINFYTDNYISSNKVLLLK